MSDEIEMAVSCIGLHEKIVLVDALTDAIAANQDFIKRMELVNGIRMDFTKEIDSSRVRIGEIKEMIKFISRLDVC